MKAILANNLDKLPLERAPRAAARAAEPHENVRGSGYYAARRDGKDGEKC